MARLFFIIGSLSCFLAVALGAFAAHALKEKLPPDLLNVFEIGVRYHFYHALGMFAVAWGVAQFPDANLYPAGWLFVAGTVVFSGSLYALSFSGVRSFGAVTPVGGLCFLAGWLWMAWQVWRAV